MYSVYSEMVSNIFEAAFGFVFCPTLLKEMSLQEGQSFS